MATSGPRTLAEKVWEDHVVVSGEGSAPDLIYIDLHLVHEVTSPQASMAYDWGPRECAGPT